VLADWRLDGTRGGYGVETVEDRVIEARTGFARRRVEQQIDNAQLRASLAAVQQVGSKEHAAAAVRDPLFSSLDVGERSLWAHALTRSDAWVLRGPDNSCILEIGLGIDRAFIECTQAHGGPP
jgi:hypothetical protein